MTVMDGENQQTVGRKQSRMRKRKRDDIVLCDAVDLSDGGGLVRQRMRGMRTGGLWEVLLTCIR